MLKEINGGILITSKIHGIYIDFKSYSVILGSYVYKADEHDFFDSWELLGSRDGETFESICKHYNSTAPSGKIKHLDCQQNKSVKYHQIKLQPYGKRGYQSNYKLAIYGIEFYGYLYHPLFYNNISLRCICNFRYIYIFIYMLFIIK